MLKKWDRLPEYMRTDAVRPYYDILKKRRLSLMVKRTFDFTISVVLAVALLPVMAAISVGIMAGSKGGVLFTQERITQYGRKFKILKFRTMVKDGEGLGSQVTVGHDKRITKIGSLLRKYRLDELPQLFNIILGDMSFCGARPEVPCFVRRYSEEMMATLLLPAGVTSEASIKFKDEAEILDGVQNVDAVYVEKILPEKMKYNLYAIREFGFLRELWVMVKTVKAVLSLKGIFD